MDMYPVSPRRGVNHRDHLFETGDCFYSNAAATECTLNTRFVVFVKSVALSGVARNLERGAQEFGSQQSAARGGGASGRGSPPPVKEVRGCHPDKILKFYIQNCAFLCIFGGF